MAAVQQKIKEWLLRYGPAELVSLAGTLLGAWLTYQDNRGRFGAAVGGTLAGNIGYFGTILLQDVWKTRQELAAEGRRYTLVVLWKNIRALFIEFGLAEVLDTFLIRPFLLYQLPIWTGHFTWGIILAKFAADVTFYLPAIFFYEWSKKSFRKF